MFIFTVWHNLIGIALKPQKDIALRFSLIDYIKTTVYISLNFNLDK